MRGDVYKVFFTEPSNVYSLVVKWSLVMLMFILQCILYFKFQGCIYLLNVFAEADIPNGGQVFIEFYRYVNSNGGKGGFVLELNTNLYIQA